MDHAERSWGCIKDDMPRERVVCDDLIEGLMVTFKTPTSQGYCGNARRW